MENVDLARKALIDKLEAVNDQEGLRALLALCGQMAGMVENKPCKRPHIGNDGPWCYPENKHFVILDKRNGQEFPIWQEKEEHESKEMDEMERRNQEGRMSEVTEVTAEVTRKVTCPLCGDEVDHIGMTIEGFSYGCSACNITFVIEYGYGEEDRNG